MTDEQKIAAEAELAKAAMIAVAEPPAALPPPPPAQAAPDPSVQPIVVNTLTGLVAYDPRPSPRQRRADCPPRLARAPRHHRHPAF